MKRPESKPVKLYNVILPIWLIVCIASWLWLLIIPGNLVIDCLVCFLTLCALKHDQKNAVLQRVWWKLWLLGFAADAVGIVWLMLGWALTVPFGEVWENSVGHILHNPFAHPAAFLWTLAAVALAGVCIYFWDRRAMRGAGLDDRQRHVAALAMAIVTAPWLFFIPVY